MNKKKKKKKKKKSNIPHFEIKVDSSFSVIEVVLFIFISIVFGMIAGCILTYRTSRLSRIKNDSNLNEIVDTYLNIKDYYYDKVDEDDLTNSAVKGMIQSLDDPYSIFLDDASTYSFTETIDGKYIGVGLNIVYDQDHYVVSSVVKNSPADVSGILKDDIILEVDNVPCSTITNSDLDNLMKGAVDSDVSITIKRNKDIKTYTMKRQLIDIVNVSEKVLDDNIGYISLKMFSSNSYEQFLKSLKKLEKKKISSLVIDLRSNPGGHLLQAKKILELFLSKDTVLYKIEKNNKIKNVISSTKESRSYPVCILINSSSASAAEVVAISMQENYSNIHIIGVNSYGKGTIQKSQTLSTGNSIKYTVEKWLSPSSKDIVGVGVIPDVIEENDPLEKAIEIIKES